MSNGDEFENELVNTSVDEVASSPYVGIPKDYLGPLANRDDPRAYRGGLGGWTSATGPISPYTKQDALAIMGWGEGQVGSFQRWSLAIGGPFGFSERTKFVPGMADGPTQEAFNRVLTWANRKGVTFDEALRMIPDAINKAGGVGGAGRTRAPLTVQLTAPETIQKVTEQRAQEVFGRAPTAAESQAVVGGFQGEQKRFQTQTYKQQETGGMTVEPPALDVFAEKKLREAAPVEAGAHDVLNQFENLMRILGVR